LKRLKKPKPEEEEPTAPAPGQRSGLEPSSEAGYGVNDRSGMQQLLRGKAAPR
jgi:hypothetical protein